MITLPISLNETYTNRCISGDSILTLIPVGCLGGRFLFQPLGRNQKRKKALPSDPALNYYKYSKQLLLAEKGQTTNCEGDELLQVIKNNRIWKKDFDTF